MKKNMPLFISGPVLPKLRMTILSSIYLCANFIISFFLQLNEIPLYVCTTFVISHSSFDTSTGWFFFVCFSFFHGMNVNIYLHFYF